VGKVWPVYAGTQCKEVIEGSGERCPPTQGKRYECLVFVRVHVFATAQHARSRAMREAAGEVFMQVVTRARRRRALRFGYSPRRAVWNSARNAVCA